MGRYQGTSGAAWAASGRVRRPRGAPCGIPGKGKGLKRGTAVIYEYPKAKQTITHQHYAVAHSTHDSRHLSQGSCTCILSSARVRARRPDRHCTVHTGDTAPKNVVRSPLEITDQSAELILRA